MADPMERQRERELAIRRENELKDLETEDQHDRGEDREPARAGDFFASAAATSPGSPEGPG